MTPSQIKKALLDGKKVVFCGHPVKYQEFTGMQIIGSAISGTYSTDLLVTNENGSGFFLTLGECLKCELENGIVRHYQPDQHNHNVLCLTGAYHRDSSTNWRWVTCKKCLEKRDNIGTYWKLKGFTKGTI